MTVKASIDVGTNSILLLVADVQDGEVFEIHQAISEPRLGREIEKTGLISQESIADGISSLKSFIETARNFGASEIVIYGTEVFRRASNGEDTISKIETATGVPFRLLSQSEEAFYAFKGALSAEKIGADTLVMDVGGGSTEIVAGRLVPENWVSRPIGAVIAAEKFSAVPPFGEKHAEIILSKIKAEFRLPFEIEPSKSQLIGVGGTITTLGAIKAGLREYDDKKVVGKKLSTKWLRQIYLDFSRKTPLEITKIIPFSPNRADIIAAGCSIYLAFMEMSGLEEIRVSSRGSRWGILLET
ncbi:MAG: hypothetical protein ACP5G4_02310 [bacterium]